MWFHITQYKFCRQFAIFNPKTSFCIKFYLRRIQLQQNVQRHSFSFPHLLNVHTMQQTLQKLLLGYCTPIAAQVSRHVSRSHVQEMTDYLYHPFLFRFDQAIGDHALQVMSLKHQRSIFFYILSSIRAENTQPPPKS